MKNYKTNPKDIANLVELTANIFRTMRGDVKSPNDNPSNLKNEETQMHFVADLLKDLVDTAYPIEEKTEYEEFQGPSFEVITITETTPFSEEQFEMAMKNIAKIMKDYKPPKAGEF